MYAAQVDTLIHTFQASGSLWQDALVMHDPETASLWSQVTGECIRGPREGRVLTQFPSLHTTYAEFKKSYPDGLLLVKPARGEAGSHYESYFADPNRQGIFGRLNTFEKLPAKDLVYGLRNDQKQVAVAASYLHKHGWTDLKDMNPPAVVTYDSVGQTVAAFALPNADSVMVRQGKITIPGRETVWDARTGRAVAGTDRDLRIVPVMTSFWFAWISFFPNTVLIK